jgi:hypothetical protein
MSVKLRNRFHYCQQFQYNYYLKHGAQRTRCHHYIKNGCIILFMLHMLLIRSSIWFRNKTGNFKGVGNTDNMTADIKIST